MNIKSKLTSSSENYFEYPIPSRSVAFKYNLLNQIDLFRAEAVYLLGKEKRANYGQFMTPPEIARLMASMLSIDTRNIHIIDPGAGIGTLFSAVVEKICRMNNVPKSIKVTAFEIEPSFLNYLNNAMNICENACSKRGISFEGTIKNEDYIRSALLTIKHDLFAINEPQYTHAILNPPYFKLNSETNTSKLLKNAGLHAVNAYTAFLSLSALSLIDGGQLVSITPRSFCNGVYFKHFRKQFLSEMQIERLHLFESRSEMFRDDDVLQENIILKAQKTKDILSQVTISSSFGNEEDIEINRVNVSEVISPEDKDMVIHVPFNSLEKQIASLSENFSETLESLELQVSTGPVVDFRAKDLIVSSKHSDAVPLIYPFHFKDGYVTWTHNGKKPDAILKTAKKQNLLVNANRYVLVKRFSAKEEKRRLVAVIYEPENTSTEYIGIENHINYFHSAGNGIGKQLALGLSAYLNSTLADLSFRQFSGHTQVNANDLRRMKYPTRQALETLGKRIGNEIPIQEKIDRIVQEVLLNMNMEEQENSPMAAREKIQDALDILKNLGLPRAQQNERSALTLLSLLHIKPSNTWQEASNPLCGITPMMEFFSEYYDKTYKPNTRETVRRQTVHQFRAAGLIIENPDDPQRPVNSPKVVYQIEKGVLELIQTYKTKSWGKSLRAYLATNETLKKRFAQERQMRLVPVRISERRMLYLTSGGHNILVKTIIEEFCPRFIPGGKLVYVGDTGDKFKLFEKSILHRLGLDIDTHGKMPDIVVYHRKNNWLVLIEAVTSHGPVMTLPHD